jgi:hypothetical protein
MYGRPQKMDVTASTNVWVSVASLFVSLGGAVLALLAHYRLSSCKSKLCSCILSEDAPAPDLPKLAEP